MEKIKAKINAKKIVEDFGGLWGKDWKILRVKIPYKD